MSKYKGDEKCKLCGDPTEDGYSYCKNCKKLLQDKRTRPGGKNGN